MSWFIRPRNKAINDPVVYVFDQETKPRMAPWSMPWFFRPLKQTTFFLIQRTWSNKAIK